jgi:DNA repair exonuclease SbcCD ATPase subunit
MTAKPARAAPNRPTSRHAPLAASLLAKSPIVAQVSAAEKRLSDAHRRLAKAHTKVTETDAAVVAAVKALQAAQTFLNGIEKELGKLSKRNKDLAVSRAAKLTQALRVGSSPALTKKSFSAAPDHVAVMDAEHRRDTAKMAVDALSAERAAATVAHDEAIAQLHIEARNILAAEAADLASKIRALEAESLRNRVAFESLVRSGNLGYGREIALDDAGKEILHGNLQLPMAIKNHVLWRDSNDGAELVRQRYASLIKDPAPASA